MFRAASDPTARKPTQPRVRPWALLTPVIILFMALPLLRPLRHPDASQISDDEAARLLTIAAIVDHGSLSLDDAPQPPSGKHHAESAPGGQWLLPAPLSPDVLIRGPSGHLYADQPPTMAAILALPYTLMTFAGMTLANSPVLVPYLLTVLGVALPVAGAAALIYRMGRLFELTKPWRIFLALGVVLGSGLFSYAVVLAPHAPAATLVLASASCMVHVTLSRRQRRWILWFILAGGCAMLAATLDPPAAVFPLPLLLAVMTLRWPLQRRLVAMTCFALGTLPPLALHLGLMIPVTGDWRPGFMHPEMAIAPPGPPTDYASSDLDPDTPGIISNLARTAWRLIQCLLGDHGLLTNFPVFVFAIAGLTAVLHRHWPAVMKALALTTVFAAAVDALMYVHFASGLPQPMFANRFFIAFSPMLLFWAGAWIRRSHHPMTWAACALLLGISVIVSLIGAFNPLPRQPDDRDTLVGAAQRLLQTSDSLAAPGKAPARDYPGPGSNDQEPRSPNPNQISWGQDPNCVLGTPSSISLPAWAAGAWTLEPDWDLDSLALGPWPLALPSVIPREFRHELLTLHPPATAFGFSSDPMQLEPSGSSC